MIACKYEIIGTNFKDKTLDDLYRYLDEKEVYNSVEDVIYSQDNSFQTQQTETLRNLKEISLKLSTDNNLDEEGGEVGENGEMSISTFIDSSEEAKINGEPFCTPLNIEQFRKHRIEQNKKKPGVHNQEEAELLAQNEINSWPEIRANSADLHKLIISKYIGGTSDDEPTRRKNFIDQAKTIVGKNSQLYDDNILGKIFDRTNEFYKITKNLHSTSTVVRGINLKAKIDFSDTTLFGHIDYAFIDDNGTLHIYNFKASSQFYTDWSKEKKEKYRYELAFIKQMLAYNGISIDNIEMNIIPICLEYDKNFKKINGIQILPDKPLGEFNKEAKYNSTYDNTAKYFIKPKTRIRPPKLTERIQTEEVLNAIFPSLQMGYENIEKSVNDWIKRAPQQGDEHPLLITEINDGQHRYSVKIDGKIHLINDYTEKTRNKEIKKLVTDYITMLNEDTPNYVNKIADAIQRSINNKYRYFDFSRIKNGSYLKLILDKYLEGTVSSDNPFKVTDYNWEFIDTLVDAGILIFKHKDGQIDTITLASENLQQVPHYDYGTNILGGYKTDRDFLWKGYYGNVQSVRTLVLLNSIIDQLPKPSKLGTQHILSYQEQHMQYNMEHIIKDYLPTIFKVTKQYNPDLNIVNNFGKCQFVNQFENLVKDFVDITSHVDSSSILLNQILSKEDLENATTNEKKAAALLSILESFQEQFPDITRGDNAVRIAKEDGGYSGDLAKFYIKASQAYLYYTGENVSYEDELKSYERYLYTAPTVPSTNVNIVVTNLQTTIDSIASDSDTEYSQNLRSFIMDFYKAAGYTSLENFTIGDQTRLYNNLYELDSKGNKTMRFKNPYTDSSLKDYERTFLKKALFYFNKYNFLKTDNKHFISENDPAIPQYILEHNEYLNVPLERASTSSRRQRGAGDRVSRLKRMYKILIKNRGEIYDEFVNKLTSEERAFISEEIKSLRIKDQFNRDKQQRSRYISENGIDYFETNVENLLIDRMFSAIHAEKTNRMLLGTKALLLQLKILGENSGFKESFDKQQKFIEDYIHLNVFKKPIIEGGLSQKVVGVGQALRSKVTFLNLAGNIISAARDVENGFMENYLRTCSKYLTDINASNMSKAYAYVVKNGSMDAMKVTLLSKLCVRYRLSNTDTARIAERLKTNRQGLSNWDNIAYSTLRSPDFLNRMTLFIARAMQDGVLDAWSVDNGELKYNWKKDKRFSVYADKSKKGTEEYRKQQALYMLHIQEFNRDHPEGILDKDGNRRLLEYTDDLPTPYSDQEIVAIKNVANNIYGSYDKSLRSMGEFTAIGTFFGMYTTWMNGMWNNWMMKPGKYNVHKMTTEQDTDIDGSLLFLDEYGNIYKEIINED